MRGHLIIVSMFLGVVAGCMDQPAPSSTSESTATAAQALDPTCTGVQLCCSEVTPVTDTLQSLLASVGITVPLDQLIGLGCSTVGECVHTSACCTADATTILTGTVGLDCTID